MKAVKYVGVGAGRIIIFPIEPRLMGGGTNDEFIYATAVGDVGYAQQLGKCSVVGSIGEGLA